MAAAKIQGADCWGQGFPVAADRIWASSQGGFMQAVDAGIVQCDSKNSSSVLRAQELFYRRIGVRSFTRNIRRNWRVLT